jgi:magnesium-transporting ATPase (P-type)
MKKTAASCSPGRRRSKSWRALDMLCADKTGTLTQNQLTLGDPVHKRTEASVKGVDGKQFKMTKRAPSHRAGCPLRGSRGHNTTFSEIN